MEHLTMRASLLAAITTAGLVGCVGQLDWDGSPNPRGSGGGSGSAADTARLAFENNVYPTLAAKCGSSGCHLDTAPGPDNAPRFFDATDPTTDSNHTAYKTIVGLDSVVGGFTSTAPILAVPEDGHKASYTADEIAQIINWLALELAWRDAGGTPPVDLMAEFSGCLTLTDFDTANMSTSWAQNIETSEGYCRQCHVNATAHMIATPQDQYMFDQITTDREVMSTFFMVDTTQTPNKVIVNTAPFKLAAAGLTASGQHPRGWNATDNPGMTALQQWYAAAESDLTASPSTCSASTLGD
ncbi:MAG TPA: hypothetical protein VMJ10_15120 [Kofleriaceae bacterium]|nr:hypothetical protein [Kofleriaceae bacterium]